MIFLPVSLILLVIFILLLPLFFFLVQIEVIRIALSKMGLSPLVAFLVLLTSLIGSTVNIPVYSRQAHVLPPRQDIADILALFMPFRMPETGGRQVIAVNIGGAVIPLLLCLYLLPKTPFLPTFFATIVSVLVCYRLSRVVPGMGIVIPAFVPPLLSVALAYLLSPGNKLPVAFISGVLGVLIGADLLNLPVLGSMPGIMSIGGAGVYDGIFLVGIISAFLA